MDRGRLARQLPCNEYRKMMSRAQIAVHTHRPDAIRAREIAAEKSRIERKLSAEAAELRDAIGWAYDELRCRAPQNNVAVSNAMERLLEVHQRPTRGKALLDRLERMEGFLREIASFCDYPSSAPEHEIYHALVVEVPDLAERALNGRGDDQVRAKLQANPPTEAACQSPGT